MEALLQIAGMCIGQYTIAVNQLIDFWQKNIPMEIVWTSVAFLFLDGFS